MRLAFRCELNLENCSRLFGVYFMELNLLFQAMWRGRRVRVSVVGRKVRAARSRIPVPDKTKPSRSVGERTDETLTFLLGFTHVEPLLEYLVELGEEGETSRAVSQ